MAESSAGEFLDRNSRLFTVLGVFGAISVYFTQLEVTSRWRRLGIVASLTIFLTVAVAIQRNIPPETSDQQPFDFIINFGAHKHGLTVFYVSFWAVVVSVAAIVLRYSNTFLFLVLFLFFIAGFGLVRWYLNGVLPDDDDIHLGYDPDVVYKGLLYIQKSSYVLIVGGGALAMLWVRNGIPVDQLAQFQVSTFSTAVLIGVFLGLLVAGVMWVGISVMMIVAHYNIRRMLESNLFDEDLNLKTEELPMLLREALEERERDETLDDQGLE